MDLWVVQVMCHGYLSNGETSMGSLGRSGWITEAAHLLFFQERCVDITLSAVPSMLGLDVSGKICSPDIGGTAHDTLLCESMPVLTVLKVDGP